MVRWRINWFKTLESFLTDYVAGSNSRFKKSKSSGKNNYNNNNNNNYNADNTSFSELQQQLQTTLLMQQLQNQQQLQHEELDLKLQTSKRCTSVADTNEMPAAEAQTTIGDNQNLCFTRWWFMLMQQTIKYNYNMLQRTNAAATTTTTSTAATATTSLPTAFLNELLGNVTNIFSSEQ
uniref:Uncharacterized protein n=1 Tax=Ceratitis capitata TaxID=7213 RepID=W8ARW1_CERCA